MPRLGLRVLDSWVSYGFIEAQYGMGRSKGPEKVRMEEEIR